MWIHVAHVPIIHIGIRQARIRVSATIRPTTMTSPPVSPQPRRGVRRFIREKYDEFVRSHSRSPSQVLVEASSLATPHASHTSSERSKWRISGILAPPDAGGAVAAPQSAPLLAPGFNPTRAGGTAWTGLGRALRVLQERARMFPPLQSAIGALVACLDILEVSFGTTRVIAWC
jgi:hypothetical protein